MVESLIIVSLNIKILMLVHLILSRVHLFKLTIRYLGTLVFHIQFFLTE